MGSESADVRIERVRGFDQRIQDPQCSKHLENAAESHGAIPRLDFSQRVPANIPALAHLGLSEPQNHSPLPDEFPEVLGLSLDSVAAHIWILTRLILGIKYVSDESEPC